MILKSHLISMIIYAFFVCIVLAIIRRRERKAQIRYFVIASFYHHWYDITDEEVIKNLEEWRTRHT